MGTGGLKYDQEKPDMSLLSSIAVVKMAEVLTFGKKKYTAHNWRKGIIYSRLISAVFRHLYAWLKGESIDPESGISHLAHAAVNIMFLLEFEETRKDLDDRYIGNNIVESKTVDELTGEVIDASKLCTNDCVHETSEQREAHTCSLPPGTYQFVTECPVCHTIAPDGTFFCPNCKNEVMGSRLKKHD
jgi:hypothetical protein